MKINIDTEELQALITFQRTMRAGALDSLETEEGAWRTRRIMELEGLLLPKKVKRPTGDG